MAYFFIKFVSILLALFSIEMLHSVKQWLVIPWTSLIAGASSAIIRAFDGDAVARGVVLQSLSSGFGVTIEAGCNGVEPTLVLVAALCSFPAPWRYRLAGIGVGALTVQAANIVRIISLYYLGQWNRQLFEGAHLYLWQALIMLDVLVVWLLWLRLLPARIPDAH